MATTAALEPSGNVVKLSNGTCPVCRSLWVGTGGTATMTDEVGNPLVNFPLIAGPVPIKIKSITLGTASDVWALY
jgi:hypothetical protein